MDRYQGHANPVVSHLDFWIALDGANAEAISASPAQALQMKAIHASGATTFLFFLTTYITIPRAITAIAIIIKIVAQIGSPEVPFDHHEKSRFLK